MADSSNKIDVLLNAVLNAKGFEELQGKLRDVAEGNKDATKGASEFSDALGELGITIGGVALLAEGMHESLQLISESISDAIKHENDFAKLDSAITVLTKSTKEEVTATNEWVEEMARLYGKATGEVIPALQRFISITGDVSQSQELTTIALNAERAGFGDLGTASSDLTRLFITGAAAGRDDFSKMLRGLIEESKKAHGGHVDHAEVLGKLSQRMAEAAAKIDTTSTKLASNKEKWEQTKEAIGENALGIVNMLLPAIKMGAEGLIFFIAGTKDLIATLKEWAQETIAFKDMFSNTMVMGPKAAYAIFKDETAAAKKEYETTAAGIVAEGKKMISVWDDQGKGIAKTSQLTEAQLKELARAWKEPADEANKKGKEMVAVMNEIRAQNDENLKKMQSAQDKFNAAITKGNEKYRQEYVKGRELLNKYQSKNQLDELQREKRFLEEQLRTYKAFSTEWLEIAIKIKEAEKKIEEEKRSEKLKSLAVEQDVSNASFTVASTVFGKNKALATAQAAVNTFLGADKALAEVEPVFPAGVAAAAVIIADGLANVDKINGIGGSGFDDPKHDAMAYMGGQKWARDMIGEFSQGAKGISNGWASGMTGGGVSNSHTVTNNYNTNKTSQFNIHGVGLMDTGNDKQMRGFVQKLQLYSNQLEAQRTLK